MKSWTSVLWSLFLLSFLIYSCSEEESEPAASGPASLNLVADLSGNQLLVGQTVVFSVAGDDGQDYTATASFSVNGLAIAGNLFQFVQEGTYSIQAAMDGVESNVLQLSVVSQQTLSIRASSDRALSGQTIELSLVDPAGNVVAQAANFYVDGTQLSGSTFSAQEEGVYQITATYDFLGQPAEAEATQLEVFVPKRKILFEDYTGTWCPHCSHMLQRMENMKEATEHLAIVSIHLGGADPWVVDGVSELVDYFDVIFVPTGFSNRQHFFGFLDDYQWAIQGAGEPVGTALSIDSTVDGDQLSIDVSVLSDMDMDQNKLVVMVLESGLVWDQASKSNGDPDSPYYQMGNPIPDFVHDDVLRASLTEMLGDAIPETPAYTEYSRNFSYTIPSGFVVDQLSIVAFVVNQDNEAINTQVAPVNEFKPFE